MKNQTNKFKINLFIGLIAFSMFIITMMSYKIALKTTLLYYAAIFGVLATVAGFLAGVQYTPKKKETKAADRIMKSYQFRSLLSLRLPAVLSMISSIVNAMISYCAAETESGRYEFDWENTCNIMGKDRPSYEFWIHYFPLIVSELLTRNEIISVDVVNHHTVDIIIGTRYIDQPADVKFPPDLGKVLLLGDNTYANYKTLIKSTGKTLEDMGTTQEEASYCDTNPLKMNGTIRGYALVSDKHISYHDYGDEEND